VQALVVSFVLAPAIALAVALVAADSWGRRAGAGSSTAHLSTAGA
jgi:hypothetical protein